MDSMSPTASSRRASRRRQRSTLKGKGKPGLAAYLKQAESQPASIQNSGPDYQAQRSSEGRGCGGASMSPEKFARMDADKRKAVIFGLVVVGGCCFVAFPSLRSLTGGRAQLRKPPLFVAAQGTVGGNAAAARAMQGAWQGQSVIERTSGVGSSRAGVLCIAQLEIRGQRENWRIAALSSITCLPLGRRAQPG